MYFTDHNLVILACNGAFADLMGTAITSLVGKHISDVLMQYSLPNCPEDLKDEYEMDQKNLIGKILANLAPHSDRTIYHDGHRLEGPRYKFLKRLRVHADKISLSPEKEPLGVLVVFHVEKIQERVLQAAITQAKAKRSELTTD